MVEENSELMQGIESHEGMFWLKGGGPDHRAWNGIQYKTGLSGRNTTASGLSMNLATVPPGAIAYAHIHDGFDVMLFIIKGRVRHDYGPDLQYSVEHEAGDMIFIEPGLPHEVFNIGDGELMAVVARSAADEWDKIVDYPSKHRPK